MADGRQPGDDNDVDVSLVAAMARGDREALAGLYERHASILLGLAMRIVRSRLEAEDLLHDVFLEAWRSAKAFDPKRGRVRTWLAIRMRSRALDLQKSARVSRNAGDAGGYREERGADGEAAPARRCARPAPAPVSGRAILPWGTHAVGPSGRGWALWSRHGAAIVSRRRDSSRGGGLL